MTENSGDPLEERLRAWADAGVRDAPDLALPDRAPTARRLITVLAVAASVVALIVGISVVATREATPVVSSPAVATITNSAPPPAHPTPSSSSTEGEQTMQTVTFKQLQVEVPASWQINAVTCGSAIADTVILTQTFDACTSPRVEGVTVVQFHEYTVEGVTDTSRGPGGIPSSIPGDRILDSVRFDGRIAEAEGVEVTTVVVAELGVSVQISSADRAEVETILATLRQVDG